MIGSFIAHGLSLQECADESLIQMYLSLPSSPLPSKLLLRD
jgi:hypothetical protein